MNDIKSFIIMNRNTKFITNIFIFISILLMILFIIFSNFKYQKYFQNNGQVIKNKDKYQLSLYLYPEQLKIVKNNNKLFIEDKEYSYNIDFISDEYVISNNYETYLNVIIDINLENKDKIVNNIIEVKFLESNEKLFYYLKNYFVKGE